MTNQNALSALKRNLSNRGDFQKKANKQERKQNK